MDKCGILFVESNKFEKNYFTIWTQIGMELIYERIISYQKFKQCEKLYPDNSRSPRVSTRSSLGFNVRDPIYVHRRLSVPCIRRPPHSLYLSLSCIVYTDRNLCRGNEPSICKTIYSAAFFAANDIPVSRIIFGSLFALGGFGRGCRNLSARVL